MLAISVCLEVEEALLYTTPLPPSTFTPGDTINTHNAKSKQRGFNFVVKKRLRTIYFQMHLASKKKSIYIEDEY